VIVAGVMSGTSADGINVAVLRIGDSGGAEQSLPNFELLAHAEYPFPRAVRQKILATMNAEQASVADLARLNFLLGELYAEAVLSTLAKIDQGTIKVVLELVGCHGQTLYHQGEPAAFLGRKVSTTWQTGEAAVIAARLGVPVVSDFRPADMAAGGKGAPLVPFLDYLVYRDPRAGRIVQNIGGIANLSAIPAAARPEQVIAFDTGPGNMVMDAVVAKLFGKNYDRDGRIAAGGKTIERVLTSLLRQPFFRRPPPKTAGREQFGREFVRDFLRRCGKAPKQDVVATATALTARSITQAIRDFVLCGSQPGESMSGTFRDFIVSGGGARNPTLMRMLGDELKPLGLKVRRTDDFGLPAEAKEAAAFALLAYQTWRRLPSNIPSATGAKRPAILGKVSYAG
jgi:anhydro-N-acetylmuramic acid kinase